MNGKKNVTKVQQLQVGEQVIAYTLTYANRKTLGITVRSDLSVDVRAPQSITPEAVSEIMSKRASWILRQLQKFAQSPSKQKAPREDAGETKRFLGSHFKLNVQGLTNTESAREQVKLDKGNLNVWVKDPMDKKRIEAFIEKWYREQAELLFMRRMLNLLPRFKGLPIQFPELSIRRMKARWGSCSTNGTITLNLKLIQVDEALIDYVIVHELCHLIEHNHSKHYYALLTRMMPDWRERRQRLNEEEINS